MAVTITSSLRIGLVSGTGVSFSAPVVPALTTDDIYNADNPSQTLTSMFGDLVSGPLNAHTIPMAINATELGDSQITDNGAGGIAVTGSIQIGGGNFDDLPTGVAGMCAYVNDSNTTVFGAIIAGGSTHKVLAFYNGSSWTVMAK